jgi:lipopolysaccharide assembly protein A
MNAKLIIGIILAGLAAIFIIQNVTVVDMRFLFWTLSMSRALLMFLILSVGIILGWLLHGSFSRRKSGTRVKRDAPESRSIA